MNHKASPAFLSFALPAAWHRRLDRAGATASLLCALHCLLAPVLAATAAAGALLFFHRELETIFVVGSLGLGGFSLGWGYSRHRKAVVAALYLAAAAAFLLALGLPGTAHGGPLELPAMVGGGLCLAAGHLLNRRYLALPASP